jgi:hypothetical protein
VLARLLQAIVASRETLVTITTLAPRLQRGALVQLPPLGFRDLELPHTHQHTMLPPQVPLMLELQLRTIQLQLLVRTLLPRLELWMALRLGHMETTGRRVVL